MSFERTGYAWDAAATNVSDDPSVTGYAAEIGTIIRNKVDGKLWVKTGASDFAWSRISVGAQNAHMYGDGADGALHITTGNTFVLVDTAFPFKSRDFAFSSLIIDAGGELWTNGARIYCQTPIVNNGLIDGREDGGNLGDAVTQFGGTQVRGTILFNASGVPNGGAGATIPGQQGGNGAPNGNGPWYAPNPVRVAGNGGAVAPNGGGSGATSAKTGSGNIPNLNSIAMVIPFLFPGVAGYNWGAGGGGGDSGPSPTDIGGGGGASGTVIQVIAPGIIGTGTIRSRGGNGADGQGAGGGGGGGTGGLLILITDDGTIDPSQTTSVPGGNAGVGGTAPGAGQAGDVRLYRVS